MMQLSTEFGFAFLCMPKCASTSIESAIEKYCSISFTKHPGLKHINARNFKKYIMDFHSKIAPDINIESFCLVRNPVDWVHSWYNFRARSELKNINHPNHKNYTGDISFEQFVEDWAFNRGKPYANIGCQYDFVVMEDDSVGVDRIFPFDNIDLVSDFLSAKMKKDVVIPKKNVSFGQICVHDNYIVDLIKRKVPQDFDLYDSVRSSYV